MIAGMPHVRRCHGGKLSVRLFIYSFIKPQPITQSIIIIIWECRWKFKRRIVHKKCTILLEGFISMLVSQAKYKQSQEAYKLTHWNSWHSFCITLCVCMFACVCMSVWVSVFKKNKNTLLLWSLGLTRPHAGPVILFNRLLKGLF